VSVWAAAVAQAKERGQARLPNLETLQLYDYFDVESLSGGDQNLNID
jgi:hypothetical protein